MIFLKKHGAHFDEKYLWDQLRPIIPYPTGRFFRGTLSQALRARLRSVLSLRDALADISQQHRASYRPSPPGTKFIWCWSATLRAARKSSSKCPNCRPRLKLRAAGYCPFLDGSQWHENKAGFG